MLRSEEKRRAPAFQFFPRQFAGDDHVMAMDLDAVGAHILLMCAATASPEGHRIPAEERGLRNRLRNPSQGDWERIKHQLLAGPWKISEDGLWWEQDGLRRTLERQREFSASQQQRARSRYRTNSETGLPSGCPSSAENLPKDIPGGCSSSSSSSSLKNIKSELSGSDSASKPAEKQRPQEPTETGLRLAQLLRERIMGNNPRAKVTGSQLRQWAIEADRMMRLDDRSEQEISELIEWTQQDEFWFKNILSMGKLREKFDQLTMNRTGRPAHHINPRAPEAEDEKPAPPRWTGLHDDDAEEEPTR